jgi:Domain of unknown function (DUF5667)
MGRPLSLDDELDALLDAPASGPDRYVSVELAPLVAVATALRAELATVTLDPGVARRHLSRAIGAPRLAPVTFSANGTGRRIGTDVVQLQPADPAVRQLRPWLRRRIAAVALAAALLLIPATMVSGNALPGQPLYPVKLSVEEVRLAALGWSPSGAARERMRIADVRLNELTQLANAREMNRVPDAILSLRSAVDAAAQAVDQASLQELDDKRAIALKGDLLEVQDRQIVRLQSVAVALPKTSPAAAEAIRVAQSALVSAKLQKQQQSTTQPPPSPPTSS